MVDNTAVEEGVQEGAETKPPFEVMEEVKILFPRDVSVFNEETYDAWDRRPRGIITKLGASDGTLLYQLGSYKPQVFLDAQARLQELAKLKREFQSEPARLRANLRGDFRNYFLNLGQELDRAEEQPQSIGLSRKMADRKKELRTQHIKGLTAKYYDVLLEDELRQAFEAEKESSERAEIFIDLNKIPKPDSSSSFNINLPTTLSRFSSQPPRPKQPSVWNTGSSSFPKVPIK